MAQYQKNFYGTSYYGQTNAYSGWYETEAISTGEALKGPINLTLTANLPDATYKYGDLEVTAISGTWTQDLTGAYMTSSDPNAELDLVATSDRVIITYLASSTNGVTIHYEVKTLVAGAASETSTTGSFSTLGSTQDTDYVIDNLTYGRQTVRIWIDPTNTNLFSFKQFKARVCDITVETQSSTDNATWTSLAEITLTKTPVAGQFGEYTITGTSADYTGSMYVKTRVWLASSDNALAPEVKELETNAGNTSNHTPDGTYIAVIDMQGVATDAAVTFSRVTNIDWVANTPGATTLTVRTRTSPNNSDWTNQTAPYRQNIKRVKLVDGYNSGWIMTPFINPASTNQFLRINSWAQWDDESFLPVGASNSETIAYQLLNERGEILSEIDNPLSKSNRSLYSQSLLGGKPFRLKILLGRGIGKTSPVVDFVSFDADMIYEEKKPMDQTVSAVDNSNTGSKVVIDMATLTFTPPAEVTTPVFDITEYSAKSTDGTEQTQSVLIYFDSEKNISNSLTRTNQTTNKLDRIWSEVKTIQPYETGAGVISHYQYGGGSVVYPNQDSSSMPLSFSPSIDQSKNYRYYLTGGWYDGVAANFTTGTQNSNVKIYWKSEQNLADNLKTNLTDTTNPTDTVITKVLSSSTYGEIAWTSAEKIYSGSCNVNDIKGDYIRQLQVEVDDSSQDRTYIAQDGDTYTLIATKFGVNEEDLRTKNGVRDDAQPTSGQTIIVPSPIVLPKIDPSVTIGSNPYTAQIVYNSVRQGGKTVPDTRIDNLILEVTYTETTINNEKVTRGLVANGKDLLGNAQVTSILKIVDDASSVVQAPSYNLNQDYLLTGNYVDWSPTGGVSAEPVAGADYYVTYSYMKPTGVKIVAGSNYQEEGGIDRVWRSPEVKEFTGTASPGLDFSSQLPATTEWAEADAQTLTLQNVEDVEYIIEDNDLWVKTWVEYDDNGNAFAKGSLQDRIPKDNWFPYIHTGYYYLGKDEYYLFSEMTETSLAEADMPTANNVTYASGKYKNAVLLEPSSKNLLTNPGVDTTEKQRAYTNTFTTFVDGATLG